MKPYYEDTRRPWGRFEEASNDALRMLWEAADALPRGDERDAIKSYLLDVDDDLSEAVQVAIDAAHATE